MRVIEGGLSDQQAVANKIKRSIEDINEALKEAWPLGVSIELFSSSHEDGHLTCPRQVHVHIKAKL